MGGRSNDVNISGLRLGKGKVVRIVDITPARMNAREEESLKRLVARLINVTTRRILYIA
jgi:hypothetical protein